MNIILMGLRGCGKSTAGRLLAARLKRPFIDLDDVTPLELGARTVAEAWTKHGEIEFRRAEIMALTNALARDRQVIALGGGTPTAPGAPALLEQFAAAGRAVIVYLRAPAEVLRDRLRSASNAHRPSLTGLGVLEEIEGVLAHRDPIYRELAQHVVETQHLSPEQTADTVAAMFRS